MKQLLPAGANWSAFGIGAAHFPMVAQAVILGGHVRVGLEDNLYLAAASSRPATRRSSSAPCGSSATSAPRSPRPPRRARSSARLSGTDCAMSTARRDAAEADMTADAGRGVSAEVVVRAARQGAGADDRLAAQPGARAARAEARRAAALRDHARAAPDRARHPRLRAPLDVAPRMDARTSGWRSPPGSTRRRSPTSRRGCRPICRTTASGSSSRPPPLCSRPGALRKPLYARGVAILGETGARRARRHPRLLLPGRADPQRLRARPSRRFRAGARRRSDGEA